MRRNVRLLAALTAVLAVFAAACGGDDATEAAADTADTADSATEDSAAGAATEEGAGESVSGEVNIDGSSTVGPLSEVAAELYQDENPDVIVSVGISGTGGGFERFCIGETDANNSSRQITDEEAAICEENGIGYDFVTVANDALSVVVNPELSVECMTVDQVNQIWEPDSTVTTWGDVEGLDLPEDIASQEVLAYGPGSDSGTFDFFTEAINGESGAIRNNYVDIGEDDQAVITAVSGDVYATGYVPYSFTVEAGDAIKAVAIDDGDGCVEGSLETVQDGSYTPLGRGLFVYFSDTALDRPEVVDFADFYVTNAPEIAEIAEFIPLTEEQITEAQDKVEALAGG